MAAPPLLDFTALIAPIPGDDPAGSAMPYEVREKLEEGRKEEDPDAYAPDDPMRPEKPKKADWSGVASLAQQVLTQTAKDLLVAARLTEALVKQHGFAGLRDGLHLLRELVDQCWDRLYPAIEDGDVEVRAGPFHWLDDADRGARFPNTVRMAPLVSGEERRIGWMEWKRSQDGRSDVSAEDIEKAILAAPLEEVEATAEDLAQSLEELSQLGQSLSTKMGQSAPGLTGMRQALEECRQLSQQILQRKGSGLPAAESQPDGQAGTAPAGRPLTNRAEAYRQLAQAAAVLRQLEPHSPIPYFIQRAVELGSLPFPQLIKALIRDANVLAELSREMGLRDAEAPEPPKSE